MRVPEPEWGVRGRLVLVREQAERDRRQV
jgi:hypothetical protein